MRAQVRPPYRAEAGEDDESCTYEVEQKDELVGDESARQEADSWVDLFEWLPHEERTAGGAWVDRPGAARPDELAYFRAQAVPARHPLTRALPGTPPPPRTSSDLA